MVCEFRVYSYGTYSGVLRYNFVVCEFTSVAVAIDNHSHLNEFNAPVYNTLFIVMYCIFLFSTRVTFHVKL